MNIINGKQISQKIIDELKSRPKPDKIFAAVLVGDPSARTSSEPQSNSSGQASLSFLKQKEKVAKELGIDFRIYKFQEPVGGFTNDFLRKEVGKIALLKRVGGVIIQLPLPEQINRQYVLNVIPREKDVDVLGERALGAFCVGRNPVLPPPVEVVKEIIENCKPRRRRIGEPIEASALKIENLRIAVVGAGFLIGKPIAVWLMDKVWELKIFKRGSDLSELKNYDLIISGTGVAGLIKPEMLKQGAGIIDFGYSINEIGKISGDFDTSNLQSTNYVPTGHLSKGDNLQPGFYTPTPNGTGPILVAKIFENFYKLNSGEL